MTLGAYLKTQRELKELKVKDIADRLDVSSSYVSQLEKGASFPSKKQLSSLAKTYGVKEEELVKCWAESKIHQVGIATEYRFDIRYIGDKRVTEMAKKLEEGLDEFKKTVNHNGHDFESEFIQVPVFDNIAEGDIEKSYQLTQDLIALPKRAVIKGHRFFSIRIGKIKFEEAGIIDGDIAIFDRDAKIANGDIVLAKTPSGVMIMYYHPRGDRLEIKPERKELKMMYKFKEIPILGRLVYHVKKY